MNIDIMIKASISMSILSIVLSVLSLIMIKPKTVYFVSDNPNSACDPAFYKDDGDGGIVYENDVCTTHIATSWAVNKKRWDDMQAATINSGDLFNGKEILRKGTPEWQAVMDKAKKEGK